MGVQTTVKEVTPDEYRAAQSANELDVMMWQRGQPVAVVLGSSEEFVPPYSSYFGHRNAMRWAEWLDSDGSAGIEPPQYAKDMIDDVAAFQEAVPGSDEANEIGARLAQNFTDNMLFIGTVIAPNADLCAQWPEERARVPDLELRVLPDLPLPGDAVVPRRGQLSPIG